LNTAQIGALGYDRPSFRLAPKDADFKMTTVTLLSAGDALDTGLMKNAFELRWLKKVASARYVLRVVLSN
jgi:hypothetical protein